MKGQIDEGEGGGVAVMRIDEADEDTTNTIAAVRG